MKYINTRTENGVIAELIEINEKTKVVTLEEVATKKPFTVMKSTFQRWWKKVEEEDEVQEVMNQKKELGIECPEIDVSKVEIVSDDKVDDAPLTEVGKEIAKQTKEKSKKVADKKSVDSKKKAVKKPATKKAEKDAVNKADKSEILNNNKNEIISVLESNNIPYRFNEITGNDIYLLTGVKSHRFGKIYLGYKKSVVFFKESTVPTNARPDRVRNCEYSHAFDIFPGKMNKLAELLKERR